ncbi:hypothetical protein L211DRAFT_460402 [Terfezia boudieri ATCC MYA-4762]|uniref:Uncharacterized protein n=1 Tax=Terfezia boudieri ATCC MYA-4762 TaxID=1051890 RepID=A0A3N4LDZ1_9PEZI|nr:hypothetical protein L211DRAFT_460402 [Terfezia boudieri ATCC MYA-4762]
MTLRSGPTLYIATISIQICSHRGFFCTEPLTHISSKAGSITNSHSQCQVNIEILTEVGPCTTICIPVVSVAILVSSILIEVIYVGRYRWLSLHLHWTT